MRRKLALAVAFPAALVAFGGLSAPALGTHVPGEFHEPNCQQGAGYKPDGIYNASLTTSATTAFTPSSSTGSGYACLTKLTSGGIFSQYPQLGSNSQFTQLRVTQPQGVYMRNTRSDPQGSYVGNADVRAIGWTVIFGVKNATLYFPTSFVPVTLTVDNSATGTDCPITAIACFKGVAKVATVQIGHGWVWVTKSPNQRATYDLYVGEFYDDVFQAPAGLTMFNTFFQCDRLGLPPNNTQCGGPSDPMLFETGNPSAPNCANGNGIYTLVATKRDGSQVPSASVCVPWTEAPVNQVGNLKIQRTPIACLEPPVTQPC